MREADIIVLCVRWYVRYPLSSRDLEEMRQERGLHVDHPTISRWGKPLCSGTGKTMPTSFESHDRLLESRRNVHHSPQNLDVSVSSGRLGISNTLEFLLSPTRDAQAAKRFARQSVALQS